MDFFDTLVSYETELWNALDRRLSGEEAVSLAKLEALRVVQRHAGTCRVQEVSDDLSITVGAASKLVDRMEAASLVQRLPNPNDRRSAVIQLTASGSEAHDAGLAVVEGELARHLADEDVRAVTAVLVRLRQRLASDGLAVSA